MLWRNARAGAGNLATTEHEAHQACYTKIIGAAIGLGARDGRCEQGPYVLERDVVAKLKRQRLAIEWAQTIHARGSRRGESPLPSIVAFCRQLAQATYEVTSDGQRTWVLGGDHSCAIGTWSGISRALSSRGPLGLIWIDAHMDSHTPDTSPSSAVHGMPLACLLGFGPAPLLELCAINSKLLPQHVCVVGVRSFEPAEASLLERLGVRVYHMDEVKQRGAVTVLAEAVARVQPHTAGFGISIDLDAIDPSDAPGVGTPEPRGIVGKELTAALAQLSDNPQLLAMEIAEFNPQKDVHGITAALIYELLSSVTGK